MKISGLFSDAKLVGFDLDNTLYDKRQYDRLAYKHIGRMLYKKHNVDPDRFVGVICNIAERKYSNYSHLFEETMLQFKLNEPFVIRQMIESYRKVPRMQLELFDGAKELLSRLKVFYPLVLISDGHPDNQWAKIRALSIKDFFDKIVLTRTLGGAYAKPHPKAYQQVLDAFKLKPEQMIFIGDNPSVDFEGAVKLGIHCIRVKSGEFQNEVLPEYLAGQVHNVTSLRDLNEAIS